MDVRLREDGRPNDCLQPPFFPFWAFEWGEILGNLKVFCNFLRCPTTELLPQKELRETFANLSFCVSPTEVVVVDNDEN